MQVCESHGEGARHWCSGPKVQPCETTWTLAILCGLRGSFSSVGCWPLTALSSLTMLPSSPGCPQDDHGYISREFHRRYRLPSNVDQSALSCSLSADGMLTFSGPKVQSGLDAGHSERAIPVSREEKPSSAPSS